ncbi:MAG: DedA family protein [Neisseriaceae bacterium]|nr:DedA family protein [Neisseriaceae bacterium]
MIWALWTLLVSGLVSATILPGNSEVAFVWFLTQWPDAWVWAWLFASVGNVLGSMIGYGMGLWLPKKPSQDSAKHGRALRWLRRHGAVVLWLSWVPLVGDALPIAAGWLRLSWLKCLVFIALGKVMRYGFLLLGFWAW